MVRSGYVTNLQIAEAFFLLIHFFFFFLFLSFFLFFWDSGKNTSELAAVCEDLSTLVELSASILPFPTGSQPDAAKEEEEEEIEESQNTLSGMVREGEMRSKRNTLKTLIPSPSSEAHLVDKWGNATRAQKCGPNQIGKDGQEAVKAAIIFLGQHSPPEHVPGALKSGHHKWGQSGSKGRDVQLCQVPGARNRGLAAAL